MERKENSLKQPNLVASTYHFYVDKWNLLNIKYTENDVLFSEWYRQTYSEKGNPSALIRSWTYTTELERLMGAKAIKLGSWDKNPGIMK